MFIFNHCLHKSTTFTLLDTQKFPYKGSGQMSKLIVFEDKTYGALYSSDKIIYCNVSTSRHRDKMFSFINY